MRFLTLSTTTILLNNSRYYCRFLLVIYLFTAIVIWNSGFIFLGKIILTLFLTGKMYKIYQNPKPDKALKALILKKEVWILQEINGRFIEYEKAKILMDCGLFFLLALSDPHQKKRLVLIFFDQISFHENRLIQKIVLVKS